MTKQSLHSDDLTFYRLNIAYDGTDFCGFQAQKSDVPTVESAIKKAFYKININLVHFEVAGRTDAGVHASGQAVSIAFHNNKGFDLYKLTRALRAHLPPTISIWRIDKMPGFFDARRQAIGKRYEYVVEQTISSSPFNHKWSLGIPFNLDIEKMREAIKFLEGDIDFESFRAKSCVARHARRYIWFARIKKRNNQIIFDFRGNAFCQSQIRIMVGTLLVVGFGKMAPSKIQEILAGKDRKLAGSTAKAKGLFLKTVYYPDNIKNAKIPNGACFPRYPITNETWPLDLEKIIYGPSN